MRKNVWPGLPVGWFDIEASLCPIINGRHRSLLLVILTSAIPSPYPLGLPPVKCNLHNHQTCHIYSNKQTMLGRTWVRFQLIWITVHKCGWNQIRLLWSLGIETNLTASRDWGNAHESVSLVFKEVHFKRTQRQLWWIARRWGYDQHCLILQPLPDLCKNH